jgi:ABC-type Zn uptake system ZnuABC Zn-binding protein ZnuA
VARCDDAFERAAGTDNLRMMTRRQLLTTGAVMAAGGGSCRRDGSSARDARTLARSRPMRIVVSSPIIGECIETLAGEMAEVTSLVARGASCKELARTGRTESLVVSAEAVVVLGLGVEAPLEESLKRAREGGVSICVLDEVFPRDRLFLSSDGTTPDPHVWLDPDLWLEAVQPVERMLAGLRPGWAAEIGKRARAARFHFEELGKDLRTLAGALPESHRRIVTRNAPLRYVGRASRVIVEVGDPGREYRPTDAVESLVVDALQPLGEEVVLRGHAHNLAKLEGLITYALDTMLLRVT